MNGFDNPNGNANSNTNDNGAVEIKPDSEVIIKERRKKLPDGTEEAEIRSGKVKPPSKNPPRVGELNDDDLTKVVRRVETLHLWSFALGPGNASNMSNPNMFYTFGMTRHMEVSPHGELRFGGFTNLPSKGKGNLSIIELGGSWFPSTLDISPVLGGTFGMGSILTEDRDLTGGFSMGVHAGMRFFRTAKAQMSLEAALKTLFVSGDKPLMMAIQLGILY